jgi:lactoylglutathione lyase
VTSTNVLKFHHIMLPVADLDRAIDFYTRVMGMSVFSRKSFPAERTHNAMVGLGTPPVTPYFELIQDDTMTAIPKLANHVAFDIADLKTLYAALQKEGLTVKEPLAQRPDGGYGCRVYDRDGHELQLIQRGA